MPKFVWEIRSRGQWSPQLFHGELPREMTVKENAHRYRVHELSSADYDCALIPGNNTLRYLAALFPPPAPEPRVILTTITTEHKNVD